MRMITKTMVAIGFVGAMALSAPSPTLAQGIYFQGPGVEFGIGRPYYRDRYYRYDYDGPYAYSGRPYYWGHPGYYERRYYRGPWSWE